MYIIRDVDFFSWDPNKNRQNIRDHGIDFEDTIELFSQPLIFQVDERIDYGEERMIAYGYSKGQPLVVVYTQPKENAYHLISARLATSREEGELLINLGLEKQQQKRDLRKSRRKYERTKEKP